MAAMREGEVSIHALLAESDPDFHFYHAAGHLVSIHALLAESDKIFRRNDGAWKEVSIHALLAESDISARPLSGRKIVSIHALLAESDLHPNRPRAYYIQFQSTLSSRRATILIYHKRHLGAVSIHALLAESDNHPLCR